MSFILFDEKFDRKKEKMEEVLVVISCFVNIILWLFFFFYFKKKFSSQEILENIRQEVDKLLIEISRETDRDLSLVDDKINELKEIIEKADQRIKLAKKEQRRQKKDEPAMFKSEIAKSSLSIPQEITSRTDQSIHNPVYPMENVVSRYTENNDLARNTAGTGTTPTVIPQISDISKNDKPVREKVLELWKLGMEPELIAEKLTVSLTEIRMIIDMYG